MIKYNKKKNEQLRKFLSTYRKKHFFTIAMEAEAKKNKTINKLRNFLTDPETDINIKDMDFFAGYVIDVPILSFMLEFDDLVSLALLREDYIETAELFSFALEHRALDIAISIAQSQSKKLPLNAFELCLDIIEEQYNLEETDANKCLALINAVIDSPYFSLVFNCEQREFDDEPGDISWDEHIRNLVSVPEKMQNYIINSVLEKHPDKVLVHSAFSDKMSFKN